MMMLVNDYNKGDNDLKTSRKEDVALFSIKKTS
jgi:hypothetical protein